MTIRDKTGLRLKEDQKSKGLFLVETWDQDYDFFERLELFEPGFQRVGRQEKLSPPAKVAQTEEESL